MIEAGRLEINEAASLFTEVERLAPLWENAPYYLGRFWDNQADEKEKKPPPRGKQKTQTMYALISAEVCILSSQSRRQQRSGVFPRANGQAVPGCSQSRDQVHLPDLAAYPHDLARAWRAPWSPRRHQAQTGRVRRRWEMASPERKMLTSILFPGSSNDGESHELTRFFRRTNRYIKDAANAKPIPTYLVSLRYFTFGPESCIANAGLSAVADRSPSSGVSHLAHQW